MNKQLSQHKIYRLWLVQLIIMLFFAALCIPFGVLAVSSALLGGLVAFVPNMYFASKLFKYHGARSAKKIVSSFYRGEALKIALSMVFFTVIFIGVKVMPLVFFSSYILLLMTHWFAPLIMVTKQK